MISVTVNGHRHTLDVDPTTPLLYVLSDNLALNGPKFGCGLGQCGACTAIVNGKATRTCITAMSGVLCRCFTHTRMLRAIVRYAHASAQPARAAAPEVMTSGDV